MNNTKELIVPIDELIKGRLGGNVKIKLTAIIEEQTLNIDLGGNGQLVGQQNQPTTKKSPAWLIPALIILAVIVLGLAIYFGLQKTVKNPSTTPQSTEQSAPAVGGSGNSGTHNPKGEPED